MACILKPECNFLHGYFRCLLPIETMEVEVKVKTIRGIHTFRRDKTTQVISCNPWSTRLCPYQSLIRKMKTYLELEGKLHTQPQLCTSTYLPDKSPLPQKTPVPKKAEKKKRIKEPVKRSFNLREIVQHLPANSTMHVNPTTMTLTTMATSTEMSAVKLAATAANAIPIPVTVYNLAQSKIQEIPNLPMRRFQGEENPFTPNGDNSTKAQQPKATAIAAASQTRKDTPWPNAIPASTNLFVERTSWPIPPSETSTPMFIKTEKAEDRTPPKLATIPHAMPSQNKAEEMCRWGLYCPICTKSTPNPKAESSEDWKQPKTRPVAKKLLSPKPTVFSII